MAQSLIGNIFVGDVVQYGYSATDFRHSQICYMKSTNSSGLAIPILAQHSDNSKDIWFDSYMKGTSYSYVQYYNMRYKK